MNFLPKTADSENVKEFEEIQVMWGLIKIKTVNIGIRGFLLILSILAFVIIYTLVKQSYNLKTTEKDKFKIEESVKP
jgi:hypothetical protein